MSQIIPDHIAIADLLGDKDRALFDAANAIVARYEESLKAARRAKGAPEIKADFGQIVDLLADNTNWSMEDCRRARALLVEESRTRFEMVAA